MTPAEAKKRIAELRTEVSRHAELYYRQAKPEPVQETNFTGGN